MRDMFVSEIWSIIKTRHGNAVLLKPKNMEIAVPVFIGALETQSILIAREGMKLSRPMTHDLFLNMLTQVNLSIKRVEVHKIIDDTFHARLVITGGEYTNEAPLVLDSRPSDALAVAVRRKCPILLALSVIEETGVPLDFFIETLEEIEDGNTYRSLLEQLEQAVAEEEYEQAAEIRDMIKKLSGEADDI